MAGLFAARVLSEHFEQVLVLDRDALPDTPVTRSRVPQGKHPHLLLASGARLIERWFPGVSRELHGLGAVEIDLSADVYWYQGGGVARRPRSSVLGPSISRPALELVVRNRLAAIPNVKLLEGAAAEGLIFDAKHNRITSVELADKSLVRCDLVVDASGRPALSVNWISQMGFTPPGVSRVTINTQYVTQVYKRNVNQNRDWKMAGVVDDPSTKRQALALPVEGDLWQVVFSGVHGESAPRATQDLPAYARSYSSSVIADLIDESEPVGNTATHRFISSQRRHVEKLQKFPLGWVLLGDAVCSFNPVYGQGMTSAAQQAVELGKALDRSREIDHDFARKYFKAAGRVVAVPWSITVGSDFAYRETVGTKPIGTDVLNRYMDLLMTATHKDDEVLLRFNDVVALLRRPESLFEPPIVTRVFWHALSNVMRRRPRSGANAQVAKA